MADIDVDGIRGRSFDVDGGRINVEIKISDMITLIDMVCPER
jgi:hypothetical protein